MWQCQGDFLSGSHREFWHRKRRRNNEHRPRRRSETARTGHPMRFPRQNQPRNVATGASNRPRAVPQGRTHRKLRSARHHAAPGQLPVTPSPAQIPQPSVLRGSIARQSRPGTHQLGHRMAPSAKLQLPTDLPLRRR
uniref:(northern house mosquito) hypothetical protein n=1 Tax=Culex pipiens TaxID=7175 RepID=A0A8D8L0N3_CULPI